jgi:hypothetical protein
MKDVGNHTRLRSVTVSRRRVVALAGAAALVVVPLTAVSASTRQAGAAGGSSIQPHRGLVPPHNPSRSAAPKPNFRLDPACGGFKGTIACNDVVQKATTAARSKLEGLAAMRFDVSAFAHLPKVEQLFALANIERTDRGLPPFTVLTKSLDHIAQIGADHDTDPALAFVGQKLPGGGEAISGGGNWASGFDNPDGSNYAWMYYDGPGSPNRDCGTSNPSACWGHRDNILGSYGSSAANCAGGPFSLAMGAGYVKLGAGIGDSETQLFAGVCGHAPTDVKVTWAAVEKIISAH